MTGFIASAKQSPCAMCGLHMAGWPKDKPPCTACMARIAYDDSLYDHWTPAGNERKSPPEVRREDSCEVYRAKPRARRKPVHVTRPITIKNAVAAEICRRHGISIEQLQTDQRSNTSQERKAITAARKAIIKKLAAAGLKDVRIALITGMNYGRVWQIRTGWNARRRGAERDRQDRRGDRCAAGPGD